VAIKLREKGGTRCHDSLLHGSAVDNLSGSDFVIAFHSVCLGEDGRIGDERLPAVPSIELKRVTFSPDK